MIEIDEATKDIMTELQDGLTKNIESGISNSLQSIIQRQERSIKEIENILEVQLSTVTSDVEATKKPITRMARDIEQSIKLIMDLKHLQKDQSDHLMNVGQQQLDSIKKLMDEMLRQLAEMQEIELTKSFQTFDVKTNEVKLKFVEDIQEVQHSFSTIVENTQENLKQQYKQFIQLNKQLAENQQQLHQEINKLKNTVVGQESKFEKMTSDSTQHLNAFSESLRKSFDEHLMLLTKQHEKHSTQITTDVKQQVSALEVVIERLISSNEQVIQQLNGQIIESVKTMEQQILHAFDNNKGFEELQKQVSTLEVTLTNVIKEQAIVDKLAIIEKDLAYARLPFYKKWFTKREDF